MKNTNIKIIAGMVTAVIILAVVTALIFIYLLGWNPLLAVAEVVLCVLMMYWKVGEWVYTKWRDGL